MIFFWHSFTATFNSPAGFDMKEHCGDGDGEAGRLTEASDCSEKQLLLCHSGWISDKLPIPN